MINPVYHRQSRTPHSEQYELMNNGEKLGHLDLHFGTTEVFATLVTVQELPEEDLTQLIERIDEDLVLSADVARDDLYVHVYVGREVELYNADLLQEEYIANGHEPFEES